MRDGVVNVTRLMQKWNTEILHFHCMFLTVQYFFGQALLLPTFECLTDGFSPYNKFVYLYMQRKINLLHHIWNSFFFKTQIFVTVKFCVDAELCCCSLLMLAHNLWWIRFQLFKKMSRFCCYSQSSWLNLNFFASFSLTFIINVRKMCAHTRLSMRFFVVFDDITWTHVPHMLLMLQNIMKLFRKKFETLSVFILRINLINCEYCVLVYLTSFMNIEMS